MKQRMKYWEVAPELFRAMSGVEAALKGSLLPAGLVHMVKLRASQINGCAYCIDMHWKDSIAAGEKEQRLYMLNAWRESPFYTEKERAALAWTECLTNIRETQAPDQEYTAVREQFSEKETAELTWCIAAINAWNRVAISMRSEPGPYQAAKRG